MSSPLCWTYHKFKSKNSIVKPYVKVTKNQSLLLSRVPSYTQPLYHSKEHYENILTKKLDKLSSHQELLYASHEKSILLIFQGMDTSGKDGAIKHVMSGVNPQGCRVVSFKKPSSIELDHDFLWRSNRVLPARGEIGIFNRSYYEEVLVTRVHRNLLETERLPHVPKGIWKSRYKDIQCFEDYLSRQGFEIIKIFLHISKNEQKNRLLSRFDNPNKLWKLSESDVHERKYWDKYMHAYEQALQHTSTKSCPWYVVPADDKYNARLFISEILVHRFEKMRLEFPKLSQKQKNHLKDLKKLLI